MKYESLSDEQLMRSYQRGDAAAFDALYARYRGTLFRFLVRQVESVAIGEELYQETWMTLIRQRERWQPRATVKTYLYRIAHSRLVDHYRARGRHGGFAQVSIDGDEAPEIADSCPDRMADHAEERLSQAAALRRCLDALPPEQREAFLCREELDLGLSDIAVIAGVPVEAVKSRVRYAIRRLRACLSSLLEVA